MPDFKENQKLRGYVAYLAANIIREGGETSYATAKKKAAKQLRASKKDALPSDDEIEFHLQLTKGIFESENNTSILEDLRLEALSIMELLAGFKIYLAGSLVKGKRSLLKEINLHYYSDDTKKLDYFLLDNQIEFDIVDRKMYIANNSQIISIYNLLPYETPCSVSVFPIKAIGQNIRIKPEGKSLDIASLKQLKQLIENSY